MKKNAANSLTVFDLQLDRATVTNLDDYKSYHNLASIKLKEDKLDEAAAIYRQAIEIYANCSWLHHYLGNVLQKQGKLTEAVSAYQQAIELYPNFSWSHNNLGNVLEKTIGAKASKSNIRCDFCQFDRFFKNNYY